MNSPGALAATGLLLAATLASAVAVVWARHTSREQFIALTRLQKTRDALNEDYGRLELEQATWAEPGRIEQIARTRMGMLSPPPEDIELIRQ